MKRQLGIPKLVAQGSPPHTEEAAQDLKTPEWRELSAADPQANTRDFKLERRSAPPGFEPFFERIVLATRLREVRALTGFTRIGSPNNYADVGDIPKIARARISRRDRSWVPAAEVRGEGIFLHFRDDRLDQWLEDEAIWAREREFYAAHRG